MSKARQIARSSIFLAGGAAALVIALNAHCTRYSAEAVFGRQRAAIEEVYQRDSLRKDKITPAEAKKLKDKRIVDLREGLKGLPSDKERCETEIRFSAKLQNKEVESIYDESYAPLDKCRAWPRFVESATDKWTAVPGFGGLLVVIWSGISILATALRRKKEVEPEFDFAAELIKKAHAVSMERDMTLVEFGFTEENALYVRNESMKALTTSDLVSLGHSTEEVLLSLASFGFEQEEIRKIIYDHAPILNRPPHAIATKLKELENSEMPEFEDNEVVRKQARDAVIELVKNKPPILG